MPYDTGELRREPRAPFERRIVHDIVRERAGPRRGKTWSDAPKIRAPRDTARKVARVVDDMFLAIEELSDARQLRRGLDKLPPDLQASIHERWERERKNRPGQRVSLNDIVHMAIECLRNREISGKLNGRQRKGFIKLISEAAR
jgi:hypothetical protein